jgi:hypothetical protein
VAFCILQMDSPDFSAFACLVMRAISFITIYVDPSVLVLTARKCTEIALALSLELSSISSKAWSRPESSGLGAARARIAKERAQDGLHKHHCARHKLYGRITERFKG